MSRKIKIKQLSKGPPQVGDLANIKGNTRDSFYVHEVRVSERVAYLVTSVGVKPFPFEAISYVVRDFELPTSPYTIIGTGAGSLLGVFILTGDGFWRRIDTKRNSVQNPEEFAEFLNYSYYEVL